MRECGKRNISLLYFGHTQCVWESLDARAEQSFLLLLLFLFPFPFPSAFPFDSLTGSWFHIGNCIFIYNWHFYFNRFLHTSLSCMLTFVTPSPRPPALPALAQDTLWNATDKWSRILAWNSKLPRRHRRRRRSNQVTNKPQKPIKPRKPQLVCSLPPCPLFAQPFLPLLLSLLWLERGLCTWLKCLLLLGMVAAVGWVALPATTCSLHVCVVRVCMCGHNLTAIHLANCTRCAHDYLIRCASSKSGVSFTISSFLISPSYCNLSYSNTPSFSFSFSLQVRSKCQMALGTHLI